MGKFIREVSNSISGVAQATTATVSGVSNVIVSLSNTTVATVDGLGDTVGALVATSNLYTNELVLDAELSASESAVKRGVRLKAVQSIAKNEEVLAKAQTAVAESFLKELMDDMEF